MKILLCWLVTLYIAKRNISWCPVNRWKMMWRVQSFQLWIINCTDKSWKDAPFKEISLPIGKKKIQNPKLELFLLVTLLSSKSSSISTSPTNWLRPHFLLILLELQPWIPSDLTIPLENIMGNKKEKHWLMMIIFHLTI